MPWYGTASRGSPRAGRLGATAHPHPVPGHHDVWNHVTFLDPIRRAAARTLSSRPRRSTTVPADQAGTEPAPTGHARPTPRRRALGIAALSTTLVLLAGGSLAVASAHKTVTLDVDGQLVEVSTFVGSVGGILEAEGVELGERDIVAPDSAAALRDGDEVVVRHAKQLTVLADGEESTVWTTALSADEALAGLATRGDDVRLVASRSLSTGRADLTVQLDLDGPVDVVVDGRTEHVEDGSIGMDEVLASLDVTIGDLDRVQVLHVATPEGGDRLTVLVQRVVAEERPATAEIPFETAVEQSDDLYKGQRRVEVAGVPGELTTVQRVILVDGVEESARLLSETVTRPPVTEVVREGTRTRPVAAAAPATASTVGGDVWAALAQCESGGNPGSISASGTYYGLYQFSLGTWQSMGGTGLPSDASADEQTQRAQALQARSGWGQWPACARSLGLL